MAPAWEALLREIENPPAAPGHKPAVRGGYIFPQYESWGQKMMDALCKEAFGEIELVEPDGTKTKIPARPGHPHMLRHTLATMAMLHFDPPWDLPYLSKWLGHKDIATTFRIYGHLTVKAPPSGYSRTTLEQKEKGRA